MAEIDYPEYLDTMWKRAVSPRERNAPTVISTFAGAGGSLTGYMMAGFRDLLAVEWNDNAVETLKLNWPGLDIHHGDISKLTVDEVLKRTGLNPGELDVLDGSPPCQGFSTAGKRNFNDNRNQLFREYVRILEGLQPKVFVMENVAGLVKGKMKLIFTEILKELRASGYRVRACLLNAMYFHVPQSRERIIFIGVRNDLEIEPSYPRGESKSISLRAALEGVNLELNGANVSPLRKKRWEETKRGKSHHKRFSLLRLDWNKTPPTILRVSGSGGHMHPDQPRLLCTAELKRVASYPDEYKFWGNWNDSVERIGNSVPPLFMEAIARHIRHEILSRIPHDHLHPGTSCQNKRALSQGRRG